jgi:hypothetical protein
MSSRLIFASILALSFSFLSCARIRQMSGGPVKKDKAANVKQCENDVAARMNELLDRFTEFLGVCGLKPEMVLGDGSLTEEAQELICKETCKDNPAFAQKVTDSSELIERCEDVGTDANTKSALSYIAQHDALEKARKMCEKDEAPLIDLVNEDTTTTTTTKTSAPLDGVSAGNTIEDVDSEEGTTTTTTTTTVQHIESSSGEMVDSEDVAGKTTTTTTAAAESTTTTITTTTEFVEESVKSPKAPFQGNRVKQLAFEFELKAVIADYSAPSCGSLQKEYRKLDYKGTNKVTMEMVCKMLDKLGECKDIEAVQVLSRIFAVAKKDPEEDSLKFSDFTRFKYGVTEAVRCALDYSLKKD